MIDITAKQFNDERVAREYLEGLRWPEGPICPHCKTVGGHYTLKGKEGSEKPVREGVWKCKACRKQFTVTVGTIFEGSHIPLHKWLLAVYLLCSSKKGMSAHQLHRMMKITYKSAWFMAHRIRYAMTQPALVEKLKGIIEADETYVGGKARGKRGRGAGNKVPVVSLVERSGRVVSQAVKRVTGNNLKKILRTHVEKEAAIMTDDFNSYKPATKGFARHGIINHSKKEYVNGDVHTNTVEGYFSILKRGIIGVYHHVGKSHLHRYLTEFDFRYNGRKMTDVDRSVSALLGIEGKRLMYRDSSKAARSAA